MLLVREEYEHVVDGEPSQQSSYEFAMRPWIRKELGQRLDRAGFCDVEIAPGVGRKTGDRLFVTAARAVARVMHADSVRMRVDGDGPPLVQSRRFARHADWPDLRH
jgi:hypothetical protein